MKTKKLMSLLLVVCMVLSVVPMIGITVSAGNDGITGFMFTGAFDSNPTENFYFNSNGTAVGNSSYTNGITFSATTFKSTQTGSTVDYATIATWLNNNGYSGIDADAVENAQFLDTQKNALTVDPDAAGYPGSFGMSNKIIKMSSVNGLANKITEAVDIQLSTLINSTTGECYEYLLSERARSNTSFLMNLKNNGNKFSTDANNVLKIDNWTVKYEYDESIGFEVIAEPHYTFMIASTDADQAKLASGAKSTATLATLFSNTLWSFEKVGDSYAFVQQNGEYTVDTTTGIISALSSGYTVTCADCTNGSVSVGDTTSYDENAEVTITATPDDGYVLNAISVYKTDDFNTTVTVTDGKFTMPAYNVTVEATFFQPVCYIDTDNDDVMDANEYGYETISDAVDAIYALSTPTGKIVMLKDTEDNIHIGLMNSESSINITLDLNGYVLSAFDSSSTVIDLSDLDSTDDITLTFTLKDSRPNNVHTGDYEGLPAGGVVTGVTNGTCAAVCNNNCTFIMEGGTIYGNTVKSTVITGAGVYNSGAFIMKSGVIKDNILSPKLSANVYGAGVYNDGTFTMEGGKITGNTVSNGSGAGVENVKGATFIMTGGEITDNTASKNGGGVMNLGEMHISGTVKITGNTANGKSGNLYIKDGALITFDAAMKDNSIIGVTMESAPGAFTTNGAKEDMKYFTSDDSTYVVSYVTDHLELVVVPDAVKNATYSAALTLSKSIDVNFKIKNCADDVVREAFTITVDGVEIEDTEIKQKGTTIYFVAKSVEPQDMSKDIHIELAYDDVTFKEMDYAVRDYCEAVFNHDDYGVDSKLGQLCKAVLNYGAAMENYVNENDDSTLNEGYEHNYDDPIAEGIDNDDIFKGDAVNGGAATVIPGSTTSLQFRIYTSEIMTIGRIYIIDDTATYCIPMKNLSMYRDTENGCYVVTVNGIEASKLFKTYRCTYGDIKPEDFSITYSVKDYCCRMASSSSDTRFVKLCKALYYYGYAANEYK